MGILGTAVLIATVLIQSGAAVTPKRSITHVRADSEGFCMGDRGWEDGLTAFTVSAWVRLTTLPSDETYGIFQMWGNNNSERRLGLQITGFAPSGWQCLAQDSNQTQSAIVTRTFSTATWYALTCVWDASGTGGDDFTMYEGTSSQSVSVSGSGISAIDSGSTHDAALGFRPDIASCGTTNHHFNGEIAYFQAWSGALTAQQVDDAITCPGSVTTNLEVYYDMSDGTVTQTSPNQSDQSGNNYDTTAVLGTPVVSSDGPTLDPGCG